MKNFTQNGTKKIATPASDTKDVSTVSSSDICGIDHSQMIKNVDYWYYEWK